MHFVSPKIIRDPVHNIISFDDSKCDRLLLRLINTKEFQRLRRIKQLGLSQLVFPGADHSRFAHSIGVMQTSRHFLSRIRTECESCVDDNQELVVLAAALLHDLGHGPFSHAFEKVTKERHEKRTWEIINTPETEVHQTLVNYDSDLPQRLQIFFDEDIEDEEREKAEIPAYLTQIVTSQLDADRFDYLQRDSYATGADYGKFDMNWLLHHIHVDFEKERLFLDHKALQTAESYLFARYHMYRTVYFHKTTRSAEVMLKLLFERYKSKLQEYDNSESARKGLAPDAPPLCEKAFIGEIPLNDYLMLDDHTLTEFAKSCTRSSDDILQKLSNGLLHRRLFKSTDVSESSGALTPNFVKKAEEIISDANLNLEYSLRDDSPSDTAYKLYNPDAEYPATQIYISDLDGKQIALNEKSEPVKQLSKEYNLIRYYYPEEVRDRIKQEAEPLLTKD